MYVCVKSILSFAFAQRKTTIADETHFCDPEILDKVLKNKVREIISSFLQTCFIDFCSVLCRQEVLNWNMYVLSACTLFPIHSPHTHTCSYLTLLPMHTYSHKHTNVHIHTHTHTYTHTYTHTHTHAHRLCLTLWTEKSSLMQERGPTPLRSSRESSSRTG